jgi:hypothetical protein
MTRHSPILRPARQIRVNQVFMQAGNARKDYISNLKQLEIEMLQGWGCRQNGVKITLKIPVQKYRKVIAF